MATLRSGVSDLEAGRACVDVSAWRVLEVTGGDAPRWLNDLVSADLSGLARAEARHSLLLSPTGGVLASFAVTLADAGYRLTQDPEQRPLEDLLARYVLSSDVRLEDRTGSWTRLAFPGLDRPRGGDDWTSPTCLGGGAGADLWREPEVVVGAAPEDAVVASAHDAEAWRALAGVPRLGVDAADGDLPHECGMSASVAFDKGCYLGQEAVARARSLGRPRRLVLPVEADRAIAPSDRLLAGDDEAGVITSAATVDGRHLGIARIGWAHRDAPWATPSGARVTPRDPTSA